jgi:hypothetical protein
MSEKIVLKGEFKFPTVAMKIALSLVIGFGLAPVIGTVVYFIIDGTNNSISVYASLLLLTPITAAPSYGWYRLMKKQYLLRFANVYEDRVEAGSTYGRKAYRRIEASKIESVDVHESLFGKSSYGMVKVRGAGIGSVRLDPIIEPEIFAEAVRSIASKSRGKETKEAPANLKKSLEDLKELHSQGILTDKQFELAKNKLLKD